MWLVEPYKEGLMMRGLMVLLIAVSGLVRLRYAVKSYQVSLNKPATSVGFSWEQRNVQ